MYLGNKYSSSVCFGASSIANFTYPTAAKKVEMADREADLAVLIDTTGIMFYLFDILLK